MGLAAPSGPNGRRLRGGDRRAPAEARMNLLLVAYFYPPCRDTGAHRPAAMAKWLRRLGHRVTVLTTSAYGTGDGAAEEDVVRTLDLQRLRARLHGHDRVDALFDSDTYSGKAHPLAKVLVPEPLVAAWAPFARSRALRLNRRERFDCVITSSPPESAHAVGRALARRGVAWVADLRDGWTFEPIRPPFPTALQRRLDERLERRWLGSADAVVCVSRPAADDLRTAPRDRAAPGAQRLGPGPGRGRTRRRRRRGILDPERVSLVYTGRFGSYGRDPGPLVRALGELARADPELASRLELVVAGPLTEAEADADANRRLAGPDRGRRQPAPRARSRPPAGRGRAAAARLAPAHPATQLQAVRVPGGRAADPRPGRGNRGGESGRGGRRRRRARRRRGGDRGGAAAPRRGRARGARARGEPAPTPTRPSPSAWPRSREGAVASARARRPSLSS